MTVVRLPTRRLDTTTCGSLRRASARITDREGLEMADRPEVVAHLTRLGLTTYEAKAYLALIRRDSYTAAQVSRQAGLPRQRIYDVLGSLVEKGLASARPGEVVKYAATPPQLAIGRLIESHRTDLQSLERDALEMVAGMTPAYEAGRGQTDPLEYIEVLRDDRAINERFSQLQANVKREILVFTQPPYAMPPQENVEGLQVSREHKARAMYEFSAFDDPSFIRGVQSFIEAGEE